MNIYYTSCNTHIYLTRLDELSMENFSSKQKFIEEFLGFSQINIFTAKLFLRGSKHHKSFN